MDVYGTYFYLGIGVLFLRIWVLFMVASTIFENCSERRQSLLFWFLFFPREKKLESGWLDYFRN